MKRLHISEFAKSCGVTTKTVYNNKKKFDLTFEKGLGLTYVVIDSNAKSFRIAKIGIRNS